MQKAHYPKELTISATQKKNGPNNNKKDVMKIQAWLTPYSMRHPRAGTATSVDGDFGSVTEQAIIKLQKGLLTRYTSVRYNPSVVNPGDIFLLQQTPLDWIHTGIITTVTGDIFETVEGNTNTDGPSNGVAVLKRVRNYRSSMCFR